MSNSTATPITAEKKNTNSDVKTNMNADAKKNVIDNHKKAAVHHEAAAKNHNDAAKFREEGDDEKAGSCEIIFLFRYFEPDRISYQVFLFLGLVRRICDGRKYWLYLKAACRRGPSA